MRGNKSYKANHLITMTLHEFLQIIFPINEKRGNGVMCHLAGSTFAATFWLELQRKVSRKQRKKGRSASSSNQILGIKNAQCMRLFTHILATKDNGEIDFNKCQRRY